MRTTPLKHVATMHGRIGWQNLRREEFTETGPFLVTGMHFTERGGIDWSECFHITTDRWRVAPEIQLKVEDVLITKDGSIGKIAFVDKLPGPAALNSHLLVVRPAHKAFAPRFLFWFLHSQAFRDFIEVEKRGTTFDGISQESISELPMPLPPLTAQRSIANFLDRETARIDALIAAKRRMVELLKERAIATIHELTSRGVRPTELADSGVHWLGDVPRHWQVMQIRRIGYVRRGASPRPIDDPIYFDSEGEYAWVRIADVTGSGRYLIETTQRLSELGSGLSAKLAPGSLFISIAGSVGKPIITKMKCCVHDGFVYFDRLRVRPDYLYYLFRASQLFQGLGKLGTQLNLNTETVGGIVIPVPPLDEQDEIVTDLDRRVAENNHLLSIHQRQIALLEEHRQALVTAAVTGQLDIPDAV